jgi:class 3 adenylate cyclase
LKNGLLKNFYLEAVTSQPFKSTSLLNMPDKKERKFVAILFADIVGYTALMQN